MTIQADRKEAQLQKRLTDRVFADPEVVAILDDMPTDSLHHRYGEPAITTMFAQPQKHWRVGDGRPSLADEDPAVMQAVGRCAASRVRWEDKPAIFGPSIHPAVCDWCEFPLPELLGALDWATWASRYVAAEVATWRGRGGSSYTRSLREDEYDNPAWRRFWDLPIAERAFEVGRAASR